MDNDKLMEFLGRFTNDLGATGSAGLAVIGNRLGLYRALARGPATPGVLAERTGCHERYLTEWLNNQAAGGYVSYDPATGEFFLSDEQAFCLADPSGPNISAAFLIALGYLHRGVPHRRRRRVARAPRGRLRRMRCLLPAGLRR
jgi:hypothetical protein